MTIVVVHPTGNQAVRATLRGLCRHGLRAEFHTTIAFPPNLARLVDHVPSLSQELARRTFDEVAFSQIRTTPVRELVRQSARRLGLWGLVSHETGWASADAVYRALDRRVARQLRTHNTRLRLVHSYEDGSLETFREAKSRGIARLYELPATYWRTWHEILEEEIELRPDWFPTIAGLQDSSEKLYRKDEEVSLASCVVAPSQFVAQSLRAAPIPPASIAVLPYGAPSPSGRNVPTRQNGAPIRILYAGQIRQHKGISYLFEALERFEQPYELDIAGPLPRHRCVPLERELARSHHRWLGTLPHQKLLEAMSGHHVFVFPSLAEGFGLVLLEALSRGLPVIATPNSAAPELLTDGVEGFIVPIRDPDAIAERLTLLFEDEDRRYAMARAAKEKAGTVSWTTFEDRIADLVRRLTA